MLKVSPGEMFEVSSPVAVVVDTHNCSLKSPLHLCFMWNFMSLLVLESIVHEIRVH